MLKFDSGKKNKMSLYVENWEDWEDKNDAFEDPIAIENIQSDIVPSFMATTSAGPSRKRRRRNLLDPSVRIMDTQLVATLTQQAIEIHDLELNQFAILVVGKPVETVTSLLNHPRPYNLLDKAAKSDYWAMAKWLQKSISERLQPFNIILRAKGLQEKSTERNHSSGAGITHKKEGCPVDAMVRECQKEMAMRNINLAQFAQFCLNLKDVNSYSYQDVEDFMLRPPKHKDDLSPKEVEISLAVQAWLCKPESQKILDMQGIIGSS